MLRWAPHSASLIDEHDDEVRRNYADRDREQADGLHDTLHPDVDV